MSSQAETVPNRTERSDAGQRRQAYVDAAQRLFFAQGYGATSMSAVAAAVGGSKTTLWALFPSKESLFEAVVDTLVRQYGKALQVDLDSAADLRDGLTVMGEALMETILSEPVIEMHRLVTGEAGRFPELARLIHERGQSRGKARLAAFLAREMAAGRMRSGDPQLAAQQFASLCRGGVVDQRIMGLIPSPDAGTRSREVAEAVACFLAAWGA